jgi:hypothetical protein
MVAVPYYIFLQFFIIFRLSFPSLILLSLPSFPLFLSPLILLSPLSLLSLLAGAVTRMVDYSDGVLAQLNDSLVDVIKDWADSKGTLTNLDAKLHVSKGARERESG